VFADCVKALLHPSNVDFSVLVRYFADRPDVSLRFTDEEVRIGLQMMEDDNKVIVGNEEVYII
jgi:hypothetical protein